jgi:hypothetical protein
VLRSDLKGGRFGEDFWGNGECLTFHSVLLGGMAGRGGRGRGRGSGSGFEDGQWGGGGPGWWNPGFPPGPFQPPQFHPPFSLYPQPQIPFPGPH